MTHKTLNIILLGPPGAGKGTQSEKIKNKYNLIHISTGDIFRKEINKQSEIGIKAKSFIDKGLLVPDEIVFDIIEITINDIKHEQGIIFDGFPRNYNQAITLDNLLQSKNRSISLAIFIDTPEEELIKRMLIRASIAKRSDDTPEIIKHRIITYKNQTEPILNYYLKQNKLHSIKGIGKIEDIFNSICKIIDNYK